MNASAEKRLTGEIKIGVEDDDVASHNEERTTVITSDPMMKIKR